MTNDKIKAMTRTVSSFPTQGSAVYRQTAASWQRLVAIVGLGLVTAGALSGCTSIAGQEDYANTVKLGGVAVADDPYAAQVGTDVIRNGGNAADAATAMALTMAVTMPSRVGLAGGGACLIYDGKAGTARQISFPAEASASGRVGRPALLRGLTLLQESGQLRWEATVSPAERLARFGHRLTRAEAQDLSILGPNGFPLSGWKGKTAKDEGAVVQQLELATLLGQIRARGGGFFYLNGPLTKLAALSGETEAGISSTAPAFTPARLAYSDDAMRSYGMDASARDSEASAGFVVRDGGGSAVACRLSMGQLFGARRGLADQGILAAAPFADSDVAGLVAVRNSREGFLAGMASTGGPATLSALDQSLRASTVSDPAALLASVPKAPSLTDLMLCPAGIDSCTAVADPAGNGLAQQFVR
ncbi:gamma-glutamyltransferase [Radicibacter daui]|uniref:gamma-glutamyltransferase n=1 Tax=Radicibacter daui TaxID=3064829 RepID=UPI004046938D